MTDSKRRISRRTALRLGAGLGAGMALGSAGFTLAQQGRQAELLTSTIPSSGERIPLIGIGTARRYDVAASEEELAPLREVLRNMPSAGCTMIDTAPSYGNAETVVGNLVEELGIRDQLFICTKVGSGSRGVEAGRAEIEQSFQRLKTDRIDLLQVHNLGGVEQMLPILREMKEAGRIRYYGMTTSSDRQYEEFERVLAREEMDFIQIDYAIDNRTAEERILPLALDRGVAVQTNLPFGRGRVFEAFGDQPVPAWAAELGIESWAQFALKYIVSHPAVSCAIPGTARLAYLQDNMGASRGALPDAATRRRMAELIDAA